MALEKNHLRVADIKNRLVGDGKIVGRTIEFMQQSDPFMDDMGWVQCNSGENHESKYRTSLPSAHFRMVNDYIPRGKSTTQKQIDTTGSIEAWAEIDAEFIDGSAAEGKGAAIRIDEAKATIMGVGNTSASMMLYGSLAEDPRAFDGLATRYGRLSDNKESIGYNIIDAGGSASNNTSIWLVNWSPQTIYGIYPKGGTVGVDRQDFGRSIDKNSDGDGRPVYQDYYTRKLGLCIEDWRSTVRIANIDVDMLTSGSAAADIIDLLTDAYYKIPNVVRSISTVNPVIYCSTAVAAALTKQSQEKTSPVVIDNSQGKPVKSFWGYKIKECDAIVNTEERVVG